VVLAVSILSVLGVARADELRDSIKKSTQIPAQALGQALTTLARDRKFQVLYRTEIVGELRTQGASGELTIAEALSALLAGTGLSYEFIDDKTVKVYMPASSQETEDDDSDNISEVIVTSSRPFKPENSAVATKFPLPLVETPQSISVLTDDLLATVGAHDIFDIDGLVPGLQEQGTSNGFDARFVMRGFALSREDGIKIDGVSIPNRFILDLAAIERVEVVRGPSSVIYGQTDYGGTINFVLKRPKLGASEFNARASVGSYDFHRADLDVMTPLGERSGVRVVGAYEKSDSFVDIADHETRVLSPSFLFNLGERTDLFISTYFQERNGRDHLGFGAFPDGTIPRVPKENFIGPDWNRYESRASQAIAQLRHGLTDDFDLTFNVALSDVTNGFRTGYINDRPNPDGSAELYLNSDSKNRTRTTYAEVVGTWKFKGFGEERSLLSMTADMRTIDAVGTGIAGPKSLVGSINVFDPHDGNYNTPYVPRARNYYAAPENTLRGISATALLRFPHRLSVMLGGRYGEASARDFVVDVGVPAGPVGVGEIGGKMRNDVFVPKVGVTWEFVKDWYAYGTYAEGVIFQFERDYRNQMLPNETGVQQELGIKADLFGKRLGLAAAVFSIDRKDVLMTDPVHPDFSTAADAQEHRGFEFEILGQPLRGLDISANYAWLDVKVMNEAEFGSNRQANVPKHSGGVFVNQEFRSGLFDGMSLGLGVTYVGERAADSYAVPAAELPEYTKLDLFASYHFKERYRVGINARNVTDETVLVSSFGVDYFGLMYREARSYSLTFDVRL
jgi:TonB-dependent siderophore receptor